MMIKMRSAGLTNGKLIRFDVSCDECTIGRSEAMKSPLAHNVHFGSVQMSSVNLSGQCHRGESQ